jgi:dephospho-CoA kinase
MTEIRLAAILRKQMPDHEKRRRADFVVPTGLRRGLTLRHLKAIIRILRRNGSYCASPVRRLACHRRMRR